jgi:predicted Rossmann-fold nucleotide-binding protein
MRRRRGHVVEIDTLEDFDHRIASGAHDLSGWHLQAIDLTDRGAVLRRCEVAGALFLGCTFDPADEVSVRARGAVVFPEIPLAPIDTYRATLYEPQELYDTRPYENTFDARTYAWSQQRRTRGIALAQALHDHSLDRALADWIHGRNMLGIMGGHRMQRGAADYAGAARLAHRLGTTYTIATGGGPGAMEAGNLGAYLSGLPDAALADALAHLSTEPSFRPDIGAWARTAFQVLERHPGGTDSLGIPTWHYGHEPSNPFATRIGKFFMNSQREALLLQACNRGIVFLPGAAGTVQELFQDACENYYSEPGTIAAMVLVDRRYWTETLPAWPLLQSLARDRAMEHNVFLVDTVDEASDLLLELA